MSPFSKLGLFWTLAVRNLYSHAVKSGIVGAIMAFGTFLVVVGTSLVDSIELAMQKSITASLAGHVQVYSSKGKDDLAIFGGGFMGADDIGRIDDFGKMKAALHDVPGIEAIVPMGIDMATVTSPGELERSLGALRVAVRDENHEPVPMLKRQVREILDQMNTEIDNSAAISSNTKTLREHQAIVDVARTDKFWSDFDAAPLEALEYLDTKVAPISDEGRMLYMRYVGTDLDLFQEHFDRFEIVEGKMVPSGHRGFLFNQKFYEDWVKNFVARGLDKIAKGVRQQGKTIAEDAALSSLARQTANQYRRITYQLEPAEAAQLETELRKMFPEQEGTLGDLVKRFLTVDDSNFEDRYAKFYELIAPMIDLYEIKVGDTLTLRAFTRSGFLKSVNVKVYGIFKFKGLESADLAGGHNLLDLLTFRELYGLMTDARRAELASIRDEVGLQDVGREGAEDELFGDSTSVVERVDQLEGFDEFAGADMGAERERLAALVESTFTAADVDDGLALNAAIILKDPSELQTKMTAIDGALHAAGMEMKVVDWQAASGIIGQMVLLVRGVLYIAISIIFVVALVIINNSMVMATMERVTEIGTMRAIGAGRRLVLMMFLFETVALGLIAGTVGMLAGAGLVKLLGKVGLAAPIDQLVFMFGGPRLYPDVGVGNLVFGVFVIVTVSVISTLYPAFIAARIQPVVAMSQKE